MMIDRPGLPAWPGCHKFGAGVGALTHWGSQLEIGGKLGIGGSIGIPENYKAGKRLKS